MLIFLFFSSSWCTSYPEQPATLHPAGYPLHIIHLWFFALMCGSAHRVFFILILTHDFWTCERYLSLNGSSDSSVPCRPAFPSMAAGKQFPEFNWECLQLTKLQSYSSGAQYFYQYSELIPSLYCLGSDWSCWPVREASVTAIGSIFLGKLIPTL